MNKHLNDDQQSIINLITQCSLSPDTFNSTFRDQVNTLMKRRDAEYHASDDAENKRIRAADVAEKRRNREREIASMRSRWGTDNLKVGMVVRMSGTRDGHGLREIVELDYHSIVARQLSHVSTKIPCEHKLYNPTTKRVVPLKLDSQITTHGYDKVTAYGDPSYQMPDGSMAIILKRVPI